MTPAPTSRTIRSSHALVMLGLLCIAQPVAAADFRIDDLKLDLGGFSLTVPQIEVKGSPLEKEAFVALFNGTTGESPAARMGRLAADEISAPELTFTYALGPQRQVTTYRNIRFTGITAGKIARGEAANGTITNTGAETGTMSGQLQRTSFEALDLRQIARVFSEKAQPGVPEPFLPVFGRFEQDGYQLDMAAAGKMSLGKSSGRGFAARVGPEPLSEVFARIVAQAQENEKSGRDPAAKRTPEQEAADKRMALSVIALLDMIDYGSGEIRDMIMAVTPPPVGAAKQEPVDLRIARIAYGEDTPAKSGYTVENLSFAGSGATGRIESLSQWGFSFGPSLRELQAVLATPDAKPDMADIRKFIPTIGTTRMTGFSVELPQPAPRGRPAPAPMKVGLGVFELKVGDQLNGIPTSLGLTIDRLTAPVVEGPGNPAAGELIAMGIKALDLSARLDLAWEAAKNELAIRSISISGVDLARIEASATLANVTKDLFSSDLALAQVAALGATARQVDAKLQNLGLADKLIQNEARKAGSKPEDVRRQYAMMAGLGLAAILGPSDAAKALTSAVSRFAAKPGTLSVQASAKSASGLGLADVIMLTDPTEIFDKITLKANAE